MIDKGLLRQNVINCLITHGQIMDGLLLRRQMGLSPLEEYKLQTEWNTRFDVLIEQMCQIVERLEASGR